MGIYGSGSCGSTSYKRVLRRFAMYVRTGGVAGLIFAVFALYVCTQLLSVKRSLIETAAFLLQGLAVVSMSTEFCRSSVDRQRKMRFSLPPSARDVSQNSFMQTGDHGKSCRHFCLGQQRSQQRPHTPLEEPSESPRHFAASMDESVIVGYYTLKKCRSPALRCLQISRKGQKIYGKK